MTVIIHSGCMDAMSVVNAIHLQLIDFYQTGVKYHTVHYNMSESSHAQ